MDAVVLAGGQGRRIRSVTQGPKCLLPVGGIPVLDRVVEWLLGWPAVEGVWVAAGYQGEQVARHVARRYPGGRVRVEVEPEPVGTAGALARLRDRVTAPVVVVNGDTLLVGDLDALQRQHLASGAWVTVAAVAAWRRDAGGLLAAQLPGPVRQVARGLRGAEFAYSAGLYVVGREALERAPCPGSLEALTASLAADCRGRLWAYPWHSAMDVGTPSRYRAANCGG